MNDEFFISFDTEWKKIVTNHEKLLKELKSCKDFPELENILGCDSPLSESFKEIHKILIPFSGRIFISFNDFYPHVWKIMSKINTTMLTSK